MTKINIKTKIENSNETKIYEGSAIKNRNTLTYKDNNVITKIIDDEIITIERKAEYEIIMKLKEGKIIKGSYNTKYGNIKLETKAKEIIRTDKSLKIVYDLFINNEYVDTFTYYYEYSIDS